MHGEEDDCAARTERSWRYKLIPLNIETLIENSITGEPQDVWMEYLTTLPLDTEPCEISRLHPLFLREIEDYLGVSE